MNAVIEPAWPAPPRARALVTTRALGDMAEGGEGRTGLAQRLPAEPVWMRQVHGAAVADADAARRAGSRPQADAAIARERGTVCVVMAADCMPVFFSERSGRSVAVAHAGWRGLCAGVLEAAVRAIGAPPGEILAWLGPAIGPRVYEVGDEVRAAFVARDDAAGSAFAPGTDGRWLLDLYAVAKQRLAACAVSEVHGGGFCTYTDSERFFSFRRDRTPARMAAAIWLA
jgi:polyphenol oxidase